MAASMVKALEENKKTSILTYPRFRVVVITSLTFRQLSCSLRGLILLGIHASVSIPAVTTGSSMHAVLNATGLLVGESNASLLVGEHVQIVFLFFLFRLLLPALIRAVEKRTVFLSRFSHSLYLLLLSQFISLSLLS